jgi:phosphatidylinositol alpha-1,6-mannosyltransferase
MPKTADIPVALLVTRNFPPLLGGMENVNQRLLHELAREWKVALSGPEGCAAFAPEAVAVRETRLKPLSRFLVGATVRSFLMARRFRPKLVIAGSGLAAPMAWLAARLSGAKFVVYLHGLDIVAASRIYQWCWLPFIRACDLALVNSGNTAKLATSRGLSADRIQVLHPGTDLPTLDNAAGASFRTEFGLGERQVLLSVGRLTRRKGLAEFVTHALPAIVSRSADVVLVVIGEEATDALHSPGGSERERIVRAARAANVESRVMFIGRRDAASLSAAYQAAQLHVFPVLEQAGDVEGFGMVALEAAAHGLRTVAFAVGGVPDAVSDPETGRLVAPGAYSALAQAVVDLLGSPQSDAGRLAARQFAAGKDWVAFGNRLRSLVAA